MANGDAVVGTFVKLPGIDVIDALATADYDFVVVDLEHSSLDTATAFALVRHAAARGLAAIVRITEPAPEHVNRLLEQGAAGIQLSSVVRRATVTEARAACDYPPHGRRSVSLAQPAAGFGARPLADYLAEYAANPPLVVAQIETASTEDLLDDIAAAADVVFIGTTDLSVDLGHPGDGAHPAVAARVAEIAAATARAGRPLGAFAGSPAEAAELAAAGARYLLVGSDLALLGGAARASVTGTRSALSERLSNR